MTNHPPWDARFAEVMLLIAKEMKSASWIAIRDFNNLMIKVAIKFGSGLARGDCSLEDTLCIT